MARWEGQVAVVTGASSGIGAAIATALVLQGLRVVGLARRLERLDTLKLKLSNQAGEFYPFKTDITKEEDILNAFKWVRENLGPVHILINSAGVAIPTTLIDGDTEAWKSTFNVNVLGLSIATREAVKDMRANNVNGHIIHINSVAGNEVVDIPEFNVYPASKFAVRALAETLRFELMNAKSKIKITNLSPGAVDTEFSSDDIRKPFPDVVEKKQLLDPEDIADAALYALSTPPHVQVQQLTVRPVDESF